MTWAYGGEQPVQTSYLVDRFDNKLHLCCKNVVKIVMLIQGNRFILHRLSRMCNVALIKPTCCLVCFVRYLWQILVSNKFTFAVTSVFILSHYQCTENKNHLRVSTSETVHLHVSEASECFLCLFLPDAWNAWIWIIGETVNCLDCMFKETRFLLEIVDHSVNIGRL